MKKTKKVKKQKKPKTKKDKLKPGKNTRPASPPENEETMDRKALKTIVSQLKEMGTDIKALKSDTDELLQKKVNEALQGLPTGNVLQKLESVDPGKLVSVLKKDCLGIFIDLSDVSCVRCKDNEVCAATFLKNVKGELPGLEKAMPDPKPGKPAEKKTKVTAVTRYEEDRLVFVRDVPNPNPAGDEYHDAFQRVLDDQPETLGTLREILEEDFDIGTDAEFMQFVTAMRDPKEGIIKLDVDLSEKNKVELRKAGYAV